MSVWFRGFGVALLALSIIVLFLALAILGLVVLIGDFVT